MMEKLVKEFNENGFVILKELIPKEDLSFFRSLTEEIVEYAQQNLEDPFLKYYLPHRADQGALFDLFQRHPEFQALVKNKTILDFLEQILGEGIFMYENCLVYKPKNAKNEVPWHQDFIDRPDEPTKIIAWMALDDVTIANGAMKVIPRSHKLGFLPNFKVKGETHHTRVNMDQVNENDAVWVEMKAGDVLLFHQLVLHTSERVSVPTPRRAFRVSYQGFEQIFTPRGTPIVLRGGHPKELSKIYQRKQADIPKAPLYKRVSHAIGRRLLNI